MNLGSSTSATSIQYPILNTQYPSQAPRPPVRPPGPQSGPQNPRPPEPKAPGPHTEKKKISSQLNFFCLLWKLNNLKKIHFVLFSTALKQQRRLKKRRPHGMCYSHYDNRVRNGAFSIAQWGLLSDCYKVNPIGQ